jgi:hypothetical protein
MYITNMMRVLTVLKISIYLIENTILDIVASLEKEQTMSNAFESVSKFRWLYLHGNRTVAFNRADYDISFVEIRRHPIVSNLWIVHIRIYRKQQAQSLKNFTVCVPDEHWKEASEALTTFLKDDKTDLLNLQGLTVDVPDDEASEKDPAGEKHSAQLASGAASTHRINLTLNDLKRMQPQESETK